MQLRARVIRKKGKVTRSLLLSRAACKKNSLLALEALGVIRSGLLSTPKPNRVIRMAFSPLSVAEMILILSRLVNTEGYYDRTPKWDFRSSKRRNE